MVGATNQSVYLNFGDTDDDNIGAVYYDNPNNRMIIRANTNNAVQVKSNGNMAVNDGDLEIGTSGHGISFAATSDASGMSNELLDDYEAGSWDPTLVFSNGNSAVSPFSWRTGKYTKVGNLVHCTFAMGLNGINSGSSFRLGGIPFAPAGITYFYYFVLHGYSYASGFGDSGNTTRLFGEINATLGSQISIVYGSSRSTANSSHIGSSQRLTGMFHYYTA